MVGILGGATPGLTARRPALCRRLPPAQLFLVDHHSADGTKGPVAHVAFTCNDDDYGDFLSNGHILTNSSAACHWLDSTVSTSSGRKHAQTFRPLTLYA